MGGFQFQLRDIEDGQEHHCHTEKRKKLVKYKRMTFSKLTKVTGHIMETGICKKEQDSYIYLPGVETTKCHVNW